VQTVRIPTRGRGEDLLAVLEKIRQEDPDEPFWSGVKSMTADEKNVEVEWWEPVEPRLLPSGDVHVECHLYDEEAVAEAERRRAGATVSLA
jgi:peptide/nickel transport system ATP-binding protein